MNYKIYLILNLLLVSIILTEDDKTKDIIHECSTDVLSGQLSPNQLNNLINQRNFVRNNMSDKRFNRETLTVPIIFHNLHKNGQRSFCDYISGFGSNGNYSSTNNQDICTERGLKALEILNEQFAPTNIVFIKHPDYPIMTEIIDDELDHIRTTNFSSIKERYNIPNTINIYLDYCLGNSSLYCSSTSAWSTYPWNLNSNDPGIAIKHGSFLGMNDIAIAILPHEIGHYFSLLHINGIWMWSESNPLRELVNGDECDTRGDLICDTPGQPGNGGDNSFFTDIYNGERTCVYQGYGGNYDAESGILKIGGSENDVTIGSFTYSNMDDNNEFWGTYNIPQNCFENNQELIATECHINNYSFLPHATNFLQPVTVSQYCGRRGYHEYDQGEGYTTEQFENIRFSLESDYSGCTNTNGDNYSHNYLVSLYGDCMFSGYYSGDINNDYIVNIADIIKIIYYFLIIESFSTLELLLADYNGDNSVNIIDVNMIIEKIIK